jgi:2-polyprenyl-3-methyl-5-hydroxy-6-metoxy-1,4-benzoquinol methylase
MSDRTGNYTDLLEEVICNLCGSDDYEVIYSPRYEIARPDDLENTFRSSGDEILVDQLVRCRRCGLQYLNPRLKQDLVLKGYSAGTDETFISQVAARERTFAKCLDIIEGMMPQRGRILDVGTAGGSFLEVAKRRGWRVAGCEPNVWLSEWGSQHYGIPIHAGTVFDMGLADTSFDAVTLWDVLEHTPDPKAVLSECHRVLRPDGLLVVNYPDIHSLVARLMGRRWVFLLSVHLYYFTFETIRHMLEQTGFRVIKYQRHWQSLELGYIFYRMKPYISWASLLGTKAVNALGVQDVQVPYWMGQVRVLARREEKIQAEV